MSGRWLTFSASTLAMAGALTYEQEVHGVGQFLPGLGHGRSLSASPEGYFLTFFGI